jgi:choline dehydrogenase-like flavoprotein
MIKDFQTEKRFRDVYDCCVIGSGPAGITVALRLAKAGKSVALIEGGSIEYTMRSQALYECRSTGREAYVGNVRLRMLGGTSNHWSGRCRPFEPSDFSAKDRNGLPGWPISYSEITRYLPEAMRILDLPDSDFQARNTPLVGGDFGADGYLLSPPTRFAEKYATALHQTPNLEVFVNCNCVNLNFDGNSKHLASIAVTDYAGHKGKVAAKCFVLAMGAIENARQLLNSESLAANGVVTVDGMAGRCFMEHLNIELGAFVLREGQSTEERQYITTDALVSRQSIGKGNVTFSVATQVKSWGRTAAAKDFFKNLACSMGISEKISFVAKFTCPGDGTISTLLEQYPQRQSRISLIDEKDVLGMRKASINWQIGNEDIRTFRTIAIEVAKRFADSGLGYVKLNENLFGDPAKLYIHPHAHHMGTTRMASKPSDGVVDSDCKVFSTENLYVAGSSIFATGGACNPTLPIIQFALRLADHLNGTDSPMTSKKRTGTK